MQGSGWTLQNRGQPPRFGELAPRHAGLLAEALPDHPGAPTVKYSAAGDGWFGPAMCLGPGNYGHRMANRYQYKVVELREGMIGGKMSGDKLENVLNDHAAQGWQLKAITSVEVKGRVGPGGVEGLLVTFERPVG